MSGATYHPNQVDHRGAGPQLEKYFGKQQWGYFEAPNGYWNVPGEPYTVAQDNEFQWFRSRILGGRTNHYGRITLRFSDYDFTQRYLRSSATKLARRGLAIEACGKLTDKLDRGLDLAGEIRAVLAQRTGDVVFTYGRGVLEWFRSMSPRIWI